MNVLQNLGRVRRVFFWGRDGKNMSWIKWTRVRANFGMGGLNIGSLRALNWGLIGKWWWRFKTERGSLRARVISNIHGIDGGLGVGLDEELWKKGVWGGIIKIGRLLEVEGIDFGSSFGKVVGNRKLMSF